MTHEEALAALEKAGDEIAHLREILQGVVARAWMFYSYAGDDQHTRQMDALYHIAKSADDVLFEGRKGCLCAVCKESIERDGCYTVYGGKFPDFERVGAHLCSPECVRAFCARRDTL